MKLYHFTRAITLPDVLNKGLTHGDFPLSPTETVKGISLTEHDSPSAQKWVGDAPEKTDCRLTVEVEPGERLLRWKDCRSKMGMTASWFKGLNGDPYKWWVYFGAIPASSIIEVFNTCQNRQLTPEEIEEIKQLEPLGLGSYVAGKTVSFEDALRRGTA